jgi:hypothetical protein
MVPGTPGRQALSQLRTLLLKDIQGHSGIRPPSICAENCQLGAAQQ